MPNKSIENNIENYKKYTCTTLTYINSKPYSYNCEGLLFIYYHFYSIYLHFFNFLENENFCDKIYIEKIGENKMTKVMFVCLGNICRSPMAEFVLKDLVRKQNLEDKFYIASAATSSEEIGNGVHYGTVKKLNSLNIPIENRVATKLKSSDYEKYDYIIGMEQSNVINIMRIIGNDPENKVYRLLDFSENPRDIADPWYTGNFDKTYEDILEGCNAFLLNVNSK